MQNTVANFNSLGRILRVPFSSWYLFMAFASFAAAAAGLAYWFREPIGDRLASVRADVFEVVGLGLVPIGLWTAALIITLLAQRSWLKRYNWWVGSAAIVGGLVGFMGLFEVRDGALATFTLDGQVPLGGEAGSAIAGPTTLLGVLRALSLIVLGIVIVRPFMSLRVLGVVGRGIIFAYALLVVAARSLFTSLRRMYRFEPEDRFRTSGRVDSVSAAESFGGIAGVLEAGQADAIAAPEIEETPALTSGAPDLEDESLWPDDVGVGTTEMAEPLPPLPAADVEPASEPAQPKGKFNKFWTSKVDEASPAPASGGVEREAPKEISPVMEELAASWKKPGLDVLLDTPESGITQEEMDDTAETIQHTLADYNVEVEIGQIKPGPVVTMYGLMPGWIRRQKQVKVTDEEGNPKLDERGRAVTTRVETKTRVKVDSIISREKDLSLALKTPSLRIETPVMGKSLVGIEVPNPTASVVTVRGVMESPQFKKLRQNATLPVALGRASGGEAVVIDLAKMPHLLIAGATGSGKSVCLNTIISCLITEKTPAEMRLLLVDPKRVELTPYNGIPHLLTPVVVETDQVVSLLKGLINEMLGRYRLMEGVGVRNIEAYNKKMPDPMPYIVTVVDELADLMMSASFDVEQSLCRLAQLGRATGIHLIVATQRPSVDVLTGLIKANFPSRVSFGVSSQIDSRTILDAVGAEKLLGRGDMLYQAVDASRPARAQGVFISDGEIEGLVNFWQSTQWARIPEITLRAVDGADDGDGGGTADFEGKDELMDAAIEMAHQHKKLSTSLLQRRLRIGYPRAARLMDQLEDEGIVGPGDGSKSRDVIIGA